MKQPYVSPLARNPSWACARCPATGQDPATFRAHTPVCPNRFGRLSSGDRIVDRQWEAFETSVRSLMADGISADRAVRKAAIAAGMMPAPPPMSEDVKAQLREAATLRRRAVSGTACRPRRA